MLSIYLFDFLNHRPGHPARLLVVAQVLGPHSANERLFPAVHVGRSAESDQAFELLADALQSLEIVTYQQPVAVHALKGGS